MKRAKQLSGLLLALVMVLALAVPAMAAEGTEPTSYSITITNARVGETYKAYKIFDVVYADVVKDESGKVTGGNFAYTIDTTSQWFATVLGYMGYKVKTENGTTTYTTEAGAAADGSKFTGAGLTLTRAAASTAEKTTYTVEYTSDDTTNPENNFDAAKFAAYLQAAVAKDEKEETNKFTEKTEGTASTTEQNVKEVSLELSVGAAGYYFVTTTVGTLATLNTTTPAVSVKDKNLDPTVAKQVKEGENWGSSNDTFSYSHVEFKTTITAYQGISNLALHDDLGNLYLDQTGQLYWTLSDSTLTALGFSTGGEFVTYEKSGLSNVTWPTADYTHMWCYVSNGTTYGLAYVKLTQTTIGLDFTDFEMLFTTGFTNRIKGTQNSPTTIEILYKGDLRGVGQYDMESEYKNTTYITYGDAQKSNEATTTTKTHGLTIFKYAGTGKTALANAEFVLTTSDDKKIYVTNMNNGYVVVDYVINEQGTQTRVKSAPKESDTTTTLITGTDGYIKIYGLDSGIYTLTETKAPDGYNLQAEPLTIKIDNAGKVYYQTGTDTEGNPTWTGELAQIEIENQSGTILPDTGGIGTTVFYVVGGILVAAAVVLLITRRRVNSGK